MKFPPVSLALAFLLNINSAIAEDSIGFFDLYPLCTMEGTLTCPDGFDVACENENPNDTEPRCLFFENKYVPGCWKFVGHKNIDFSLVPKNMPPSTMIKVTGSGGVYTLNRDTIGCKKL